MVMELILSSTYQLQSYDICVTVGMNPAYDYDDNVIMYQTNEPLNSVILRVEKFIELINLLKRFTDESAQRLDADVRSPTGVGGETTHCFEFEDYNVNFLINCRIIRFSRKISLFPDASTSSASLDIFSDTLTWLLNLKTTLLYKFKFLEIYKPYARRTHSRIIDFFVSAIFNKKVSHKCFLDGQLESFQTILIALPSSVLPPTFFLFPHKSKYDTSVCELLDSEIRFQSYKIIFDHLSRTFKSIPDPCEAVKQW
jgi:hypothetical protein